MDQPPLRILAIVNVPWDPRLGAARVWIELTEEWIRAGHTVEKFCLTDAFPKPAASSALAAVHALLFPYRAARFVRQNADRFDVIDALVGTLPFSKRSLLFSRLLVARSVGLYRLYEKFEREAARRWPPSSKGKAVARPFYRFFNRRMRAASEASVRRCDVLNLPNSDELLCVREEMELTKPAMVQPYGLSPGRREELSKAAGAAESRWRKKKIVFLGMWSPRKGAREWGQLVRKIRARVPDARFVFLGTMIDTQQVWNDLGFGPVDFVEVVPQFSPEELPRLLSDCAVGAFPSYVEGFGMAVIEQMAAGLPTAAYDAPGPRDILRDDLPELLVPPGEVDRLSDTIATIFERGLARYQDLSERSVRTATRFSWPKIAGETVADYRKHLKDVTAA